MIYHIAETTSTNDEARDRRYRDMDIVWADFQTAGRGQRGHTWESAKGVNLTFSVVLEPTFLPIGEQFLLSEAVALSLCDMFAEYGITTRIKWTNDIYIGDKKIVGILIEHSLSGDRLARTIVGIGINVNQTEFSSDLPNPTSMALEMARQFDTAEVLESFANALSRNWECLRSGEKVALQSRYIERMYRLGEKHNYRLADGTKKAGIIRGVRPSGELMVEHDDGKMGEYLFKQIEFVLAE